MTALGLVAAGIAGAAIGSFACVLARRSAEGRDWVVAPSACEACGARLGARDLVPVVSFVLGRGRCRLCRAPIPRDHLAFELLGAGVPLWLAVAVPGETMPWGCALGWLLLALAGADARSFRLPLPLTAALAGLGMAATAAIAPERLGLHALAALAGWAGLAAVAVAYRRLRRREGLGGGDALLLAAGGAWVGPEALPGIVAMASVSALAFAVATGKGRPAADRPIPFGPFLAAGIWLSWLWGPLLSAG